MPIYEFACPRCRRIFSFLSKRLNPDRQPVCPRCGHDQLVRQISSFSLTRGSSGSAEVEFGPDTASAPDLDDPRMERAMAEMERDLAHMDENNPRHLAHMMRRMKDLMPPGALPKDIDVAIKRLEAGEDPERIEADMGDLLGGLMDQDQGDSSGSSDAYSRDPGLYDY